jgi:ABC-2 type transport system permease protein
MKRSLRLIAAFLRLNVVSLMEYKANFFIEAGIHLFFQATNLIFFGVIWQRVGGFAGLTPKEMLFFIGTFVVSDSLLTIFAFFGILELPAVIRDGTMDMFLTKPVSSQFYATFRSPSVVTFLDLSLGIALVAIAAASGELKLAPFGWPGWLALVVAGTTISYSAGVIIMSLSFIVLSVNAVWTLYTELGDAQRYPIGVFPQPWRTLFTITLPTLLVANVPAHFALNKASFLEVAWFVAIGGTLVFASTRFWKYGLKRYQSASS